MEVEFSCLAFSYWLNLQLRFVFWFVHVARVKDSKGRVVKVICTGTSGRSNNIVSAIYIYRQYDR